MKRTIATLTGALLLATGGQALAAGPPVADVGLGAGLGCAAQCIKEALVDPTMTGGTLQVKTDTPARIKIWVSHQAPGYIDGKPWIPNPDDYLETWEYYTSRTFQLDSLAAGTLYHILVTATDHEGHTAYRLGTFTTDNPPPLPPAVHSQTVEVTFYKVKILNDADQPGKGEIRFDYLVGDEHVLANGERKLKSGQSITPHDRSQPLVIENLPDAFYLKVRGCENDLGKGCGIEEAFVDPYDCGSFDYSDVSCAHVSIDLGNLHDQVWNGDYGGMPYGHDAYLVFESPNDDYLEFRVYAYVDVVDA
jgi:hypothetical protein